MFSLWRNKSVVTIRCKLARNPNHTGRLLSNGPLPSLILPPLLPWQPNLALVLCSLLTGCSFPDHNLKSYVVQPTGQKKPQVTFNQIGNEEYTHLGSKIRCDNSVVKTTDSGTREYHVQSLTQTVNSQVTLQKPQFPHLQNAHTNVLFQ